MFRYALLSFTLFSIFFLSSCNLFNKESNEKEVYGCTDLTAANYNENANIDDGNCVYDSLQIVYGCTDPGAINYDPNANLDNETCIYDSAQIVYGCIDSNAVNYDPFATIDDGSCDYCSDPYNFILITKDGGITWDKKCFNLKISQIVDVSIVDENNIWVCTNPRILGQTTSQILHSGDGGYTWSIQYDGSDIGFSYIEMFSEYKGVAMADADDFYANFYKTIDGGRNWTQTSSQRLGWTFDDWRSVNFVNINNGYFYGVFPNTWGYLYSTPNSGQTWDAVHYPDSTNVGVMEFFNTEIGIVSASSDKLLQTSDRGENWNLSFTDFGGGWAVDIEFHPTDQNKIWMVGSKMFYSDDQGLTWTEQKISEGPIYGEDIYTSMNSVWTSTLFQIFVNKNISQNVWESIQLPLEDNEVINGEIDGVGDDIIVLPGHAYR